MFIFLIDILKHVFLWLGKILKITPLDNYLFAKFMRFVVKKEMIKLVRPFNTPLSSVEDAFKKFADKHKWLEIDVMMNYFKKYKDMFIGKPEKMIHLIVEEIIKHYNKLF